MFCCFLILFRNVNESPPYCHCLQRDNPERHSVELAVIPLEPYLHLQTGSDGTGKANQSLNIKTILMTFCIILPGYPLHESYDHGISNYQVLIHGHQLHTSEI